MAYMIHHMFEEQPQCAYMNPHDGWNVHDVLAFPIGRILERQPQPLQGVSQGGKGTRPHTVQREYLSFGIRG